MNCFEWQSRSSEYLDGSLAPELKANADRHLQACQDCGERHQRYRLILTSIASQPRISMPPTLRKAPLTALLPPAAPGEEIEGTPPSSARANATGPAAQLRAWWERIPWLVRTTIEGTGIVLLILIGISAGPKLRKMYERHLEQSLGEFTESFNADGGKFPGEDSVPLARGNVAAAPAASETTAGTEPGAPGAGADAAGPAGSDDYSGENDDDTDDVASSDDGEANDEGLRVGSSEIWRFNLKTDSPREVRHRIVQILGELHVASTTQGFGGVEAPGGIQFDLLVPKGIVLELKKQLQKLSPKQVPAEGSTVASADNFTWYKNKSKRKLAEGRARVVIWLSQI